MEERERESAKPDSKQGASAPSSSTTIARGHEARAASKDEDGGAGKTDVCSEKFDPLLALYSPAVPLPFPGIKCFNNVAEYEGFLKGGRGRAKAENVEKRQRKAMKGVVDPERIERLKKLMVNNPAGQEEEGGEGSSTAPRRRRQRAEKNVLTRMTLCKGSPLGELHRCVQERIRVRVYIRTFKGLRGVCSGFVVAFDKFWNMAMVDVDETYKEPVFGEEFYHEKALTVSRLFEKLKLQESEESSKTVDSQGKAGQHVDPEASLRSSSADARDGGRTSEQSEAAQPKKATQKGSRHQQAHLKPYGRVHTRHVSQLFIRGESVILVNPQPL